MHKHPGLASFRVAQVNGEHFFVAGSDQSLRSVVERMRDENCPVAVLTENEQIVGVIEGSAVVSHVVGQPGQWDRPAGSIASAAAQVESDSSAASLQAHLQNSGAAVIVKNGSGLPAKVITRASWLRFLNSAVNTVIFQTSPHLDVESHSHAHPVAK